MTESMSGTGAFGLGFLLASVNPKNLVLVISGATVIADATAVPSQQLVAAGNSVRGTLCAAHLSRTLGLDVPASAAVHPPVRATTDGSPRWVSWADPRRLARRAARRAETAA